MKKKLSVALLVVVIVGIVLANGFVFERGRALPNVDYSIYLPVLMKNYPPPPPTFGFEVSSLTDPDVLQKAVDTGNYWVRMHVLNWDQIQPTAGGGYDWSSVDEQTLQNVSANGMETIAVVKYAPDWAQKIAGVKCGPIMESALDDFAAFLAAAVTRYSQPPYNIQYWELGNEPDVDPDLVAADSIFGCWGDDDDDYYGGGYYAEMLKVVYPAIKSADPEAQVLIGGLLIDCDPTNPPLGKDCKPAKFFDGILQNGGADYFDIVSFHGYPPYYGGTIHDENYPSWDTRGGIVLGKMDFLREVMANYGVDKPLLHSEGSLICPEWAPSSECDPPDDAFFEAQADYVVWLYVRNIAADALGTIWYLFPGRGWRYGGMLGSSANPKPAYNAYKFLTGYLSSAEYMGEMDEYLNLHEYKFAKSGTDILVLWASDQQPHEITLPLGYTRVLDKYGNEISVTGATLSVDSPVYIEY